MRLELSDQYWEIELDERTLTTRYGRLGTRGAVATMTYSTLDLARRGHDHEIVERLKEGYRPVDLPPIALPAVANRELEAAIRDQPGDPGPYLVYADWLQTHHSPLGELMVLMHQVEGAHEPKARKRLDAMLGRLGLPLPDRASFGWRWGLWTWLRIHNALDDRDTRVSSSFDAIATARELFESPLCGVLEELRIGALRWDENHKLVAPVLEEAARRSWARSLTRLHVGDADDPDYTAGSLAEVVSRGFPSLAALRVRSSSRLDLRESWSPFVLPRLTELAVESAGLVAPVLRDVLASQLPSLEQLELWLGRYDFSLEHLDPLLSGAALPGVRRLGLRNAWFADDVVAALLDAPIAARLEALDLSLGTLTVQGVVRLAEAAPRLPRLIRLDVDDNYLTSDALHTLANAFPRACVTSREQKVRIGELRPSFSPSWERAAPIARVGTVTG